MVQLLFAPIHSKFLSVLLKCASSVGMEFSYLPIGLELEAHNVRLDQSGYILHIPNSCCSGNMRHFLHNGKEIVVSINLLVLYLPLNVNVKTAYYTSPRDTNTKPMVEVSLNVVFAVH